MWMGFVGICLLPHSNLPQFPHFPHLPHLKDVGVLIVKDISYLCIINSHNYVN